MKKIVALVLLATSAISTQSCKKDSVETITACQVQDPVNNLPWLKKKLQEDKDKDQDQFVVVKTVEFKGQTVFNYQIIWMSCIACANFDCEGNSIDNSQYTQEEFQQLIKALSENSRIVFKGKSAF